LKPKTKKILSYAILILLGVIVIFLVIQALLHMGGFGTWLSGMVQALRAILIGCVMAYLLYPLARISEDFLIFHHAKPKTARKLSTAFATITLLLLLFLFLYFVIPELILNVPSLLQNIPQMVDTSSKQLSDFLAAHNLPTSIVEDVSDRISKSFTSWLQDDPVSKLMDVADRLASAARNLLNFVIGIIVMVYLLLGRDEFVGQGKKLLYAFSKKRNTCDRVLTHLREVNRIFGGFVSGKLLDSLIIGVICFVVLSILQIPYTLLISVIVGVTNIIPVFGPFFGAVPCIFLLLLVDPSKCLVFIIFIIILQQVDGNIIGPKILGDSTGLSAFWVLFALLFFNFCMGFWGMLLGVPIFASVYYLGREFVDSVLRKKNLPTETEEYLRIHDIDENGNITYHPPKELYFPPFFRGEDSLWRRFLHSIKKLSRFFVVDKAKKFRESRPDTDDGTPKEKEDNNHEK